MYIDGVILFSILIVILTCAVAAYFGFYVRKHFKQDELKSVKKHR